MLDCATSVYDEDAMPSPGDFTVCIYCSSILVYENDMALRKMVKEEFELLPEETRIQLNNAKFAIIYQMRKRQFEKSLSKN